jgi:MFS family permease
MSASVIAAAVETVGEEQVREVPVADGWPSQGAARYGLTIAIIATLFNFFDANVFTMMVQRIKVDFALSDEQLGWLLGPANVIFFVLIGVPLARLVDIYPRKFVLAGGVAAISLMTMAGALSQSFRQLFVSRMFVGVSGSAHAPGAYSILADYYPPARLPRAIGFLQIGYIGGTALGMLLGGFLVTWAAGQPPVEWMGLTIRGWQMVLIAVAAPSLVIAVLMLFMHEPPRRGIRTPGKSLPLREVFAEIAARKAVYAPLFIGLALSVTEAQGLISWRVPFMVRTYGWSEAMIGLWAGPAFLVSALAGAFFGTLFVERLARRYKDANVRATAILFACAAPFSASAPFMPTGELAMLMFSIGGMFGIAAAVPQNAAIQRITPGDMRGQVTAIYLFFFTVFMSLGSLFIGMITDRFFGNEADLWKAMAMIALVLMPAAAIAIASGIKAYGREIERLEAQETAAA